MSLYQALTRAGQDVENFLFVQSVLRGEEPSDSDFTILIRTVCTDHWVGALDTVLNILQSKSLSCVNVEMYDQRAILAIFPVLDLAPGILQKLTRCVPRVAGVSFMARVVPCHWLPSVPLARLRMMSSPLTTLYHT